MECYQHPGAAATATCVGCARPICDACREGVAGHAMCHPCVAAAAARLAAEPASTALAETGARAAPTDEDTAVPADVPWAAAPAVHEAGLDQLPALTKESARPGVIRRIARGLLWGVVYGQWWTLMMIVSAFFWGAMRSDLAFDSRLIVIWVIFAVVYGFFGSLSGFIIGASNAFMGTGVAIGIGTGMILCGLQALAQHDPGDLVNVIFYFFTGRFIGAAITRRVQQPMARTAVGEVG